MLTPNHHQGNHTQQTLPPVHNGWRFSAVVKSCSTLSPVSTGMCDRLRAGIPLWYVTKPTRSTQPCIPLRSLNRVPAFIDWGKGGNVTSDGWQVTLCDPICACSTNCYMLPVSYTHLTLPTILRV